MSLASADPPCDPDALQTFALTCHVNCRWQRLQAARLTFRLHTFKIDKPKFEIARQSIVVRDGPRILVGVSVEAERLSAFAPQLTGSIACCAHGARFIVAQDAAASHPPPNTSA